jgi:hypothetical protein
MGGAGPRGTEEKQRQMEHQLRETRRAVAGLEDGIQCAVTRLEDKMRMELEGLKFQIQQQEHRHVEILEEAVRLKIDLDELKIQNPEDELKAYSLTQVRNMNGWGFRLIWKP